MKKSTFAAFLILLLLIPVSAQASQRGVAVSPNRFLSEWNNRYRTIWSQTFRWFSPQSDYNYRKCPHWNVLDLRLQQL